MDSRADCRRDDLNQATAPSPASPVDGEILSIIVPVYNEPENFPRVVEAVERHVPPPFRLWMVYDFEEDSTLPVARELAQTRSYLRLLKNDLGRGPANALRAGFAAVNRGPALVVMADLSDDLGDVPAMLQLYQAGYRVVCASRYMRGGRQIGGPWFKRVLSRSAGLSLHWLARFPVHDATNNFRLYDAALVNEMGIESERGFEIALELTAKAVARDLAVTETPTTWRDRSAGESRFRLWKWLPCYFRWYWFAMTAGSRSKVGSAANKTPAQQR